MILDDIIEKVKERYKDLKDNLDDIKEKASRRTILNPNFFYNSINKEGMNFICEIKKASPSKGIISEDFPYLSITKEYNNIADAISVLTEPYFFKGSNEILSQVKSVVNVPILRKDFIIYPYQIYEAKFIGADAILLICAILNDKELKEYYDLAKELGLGVLVEAHDEVEVQRALNIGAKVIGVNNRNLKDFTVDTKNSINLRNKAPKNITFVSESGIKTREDIKKLLDNDIHVVLIGETLMRAKDKVQIIKELKYDKD